MTKRIAHFFEQKSDLKFRAKNPQSEVCTKQCFGKRALHDALSCKGCYLNLNLISWWPTGGYFFAKVLACKNFGKRQ